MAMHSRVPQILLIKQMKKAHLLGKAEKGQDRAYKPEQRSSSLDLASVLKGKGRKTFLEIFM